MKLSFANKNYLDARCRNSIFRTLIVSKQDSNIKISANFSHEFVDKLINKNYFDMILSTSPKQHMRHLEIIRYVQHN